MNWHLQHIMLSVALLIIGSAALAQNMSINETGTEPNASAMLDVQSTSMGFLMPRMTAAQRAAIATPAHQLLVMQTDQSEGLYMYDSVNSNWLHLLDSVAIAAMIQTTGTPSLDSVLAMGNDGGGDSILNVNALAIGGSDPSAQVQIDSFTVIEGSGFENAYGWFGFNTKKSSETTLTYLHTGTPSLMAAGDNFLGFFLWPNGTSGDTLANDATAYLRIQENEIEMNNTTQIFQFGDHFEFNEGRMEVQSTGNSVIIGNNAGANDDFTNNSNILIGTNAGAATTTAIRTVAIGEGAMQSQTTQNNNIGIGYNAGNGLTGISNIAIGSYALGSASGAGQSTAIGYTAAENATGSSNTVIGYAALKSNATGANNVAVGVSAGENSSGSGNVFIGRLAGQSAAGNNQLYIENSNSTNPLIYGNFSNDSLLINGMLNINQAYTLPTTDGANNQVLRTNGNGKVEWSTIAAAAGTTSVGDTDGDTYVETEENTDDDTLRLYTAGTQRMNINPDGNVVIGAGTSDARLNVNGTMSKNVSTLVLANALSVHNVNLGSDANVVRLTGGNASGTSISGFAATFDGHVVHLINRSGVDIDLLHNSTGSIAANRILGYNNGDMALKSNSGATMIYSSTDARWLVLFNK